jgi:YegS/Rv2252/BmrU family lipid kinase
MALRRLFLAVNPKGGLKRGASVLARVRPLFEEAGVELAIHETSHPGHARELVETLDLEGLDGLCAVGGDGTMHEMVNGLLARPDKADLPLGLIPAGSGNAFLYGFGIHDPIEAARRILAGAVYAIDVARLTLDERVIYAFNVLGWGLVTDITIRAEKLRWIGDNRYTAASALEILRARQRKAKLVTAELELDEGLSFFMACNTPYTGKGMRMAPRADCTDGLIDLVIVRKATRRQMLALLPKVFDGSHLESPLVEYVQTKFFDFIPEVDETVNIDGELVEWSPLHVEMVPRVVRVMV